jgi:hypothetical protein
VGDRFGSPLCAYDWGGCAIEVGKHLSWGSRSAENRKSLKLSMTLRIYLSQAPRGGSELFKKEFNE